VQNGTTLPLKFQLLGFADGNVVEDMQDIFVTIEGEGLEQTWELGGGRNALRFDERDFHYILNFHTRDYELVDGSIYKATVYNSDGKKLGRSISFELSSTRLKLKK
jgi:hypothetical protein